MTVKAISGTEGCGRTSFAVVEIEQRMIRTASRSAVLFPISIAWAFLNECRESGGPDGMLLRTSVASHGFAAVRVWL